jgi:hypothetical protein
LQHADEGARRIFEAFGDILAIADAPIGDSSSTDRAQERRVVLGSEFIVDVAAQGLNF